MDCNTENLYETLKATEKLHFPAGPIYERCQKLLALECIKENELEAIYHLVESHASSLRLRASISYDRALTANSSLPLNRNYFGYKCNNVNIDDKIETMLKQLKELPEEWTVVQLTSQFNQEESLAVTIDKHYTSPLHVTVFHRSADEVRPFTLTVGPPRDGVDGNIIEIRNEMYSLLKDNCKALTKISKELLRQLRFELHCRLLNILRDIETKWLAAWRCLLVGKFEQKLEDSIAFEIKEIVNNNKEIVITERQQHILVYLFRGGDTLNNVNLRNALKDLFPDYNKKFRAYVHKTIENFALELQLSKKKRKPLIIVMDEKLDIFPWESMKMLENHPVSRIPSLHFLYALFKEHESTIVDGYKICTRNGAYMVNPGLDLEKMEKRMRAFFKYWLPNWPGIAGQSPSEENFKDYLTNYDIFLYCGHGNGTQFLRAEKIQKIKVSPVVMLFGCSSVHLTMLGPQVQLFGSYEMYLIACCPCIIGMLWDVTDTASDVICTELLSNWLPSEAKKHWKFTNLKTWAASGKINFNPDARSKFEEHDPDLLHALSKARKATDSLFVRTACVARGLPVKMK